MSHGHWMRDVDIVKRFEALENMTAIGKLYGITRERVRQILLRDKNYTGKDRIYWLYKEAVADYRDGDDTLSAVAERHNLDRATLGRALTRSDVQVDRARQYINSRLPMERQNQIVTMYKGGFTLNEIRTDLGNSTQTIMDTLERRGIKRRSTGRRGPKKPWTEKETVTLIYLRDHPAGYGQITIGEMMGRCQTTICGHLKKLREQKNEQSIEVTGSS